MKKEQPSTVRLARKALPQHFFLDHKRIGLPLSCALRSTISAQATASKGFIHPLLREVHIQKRIANRPILSLGIVRMSTHFYTFLQPARAEMAANRTTTMMGIRATYAGQPPDFKAQNITVNLCSD